MAASIIRYFGFRLNSLQWRRDHSNQLVFFEWPLWLEPTAQSGRRFDVCFIETEKIEYKQITEKWILTNTITHSVRCHLKSRLTDTILSIDILLCVIVVNDYMRWHSRALRTKRNYSHSVSTDSHNTWNQICKWRLHTLRMLAQGSHTDTPNHKNGVFSCTH